MSEESILEQIALLDEEIDIMRSKISKLKKALMDEETEIIPLFIKKDELLEQLRRLKNSR